MMLADMQMEIEAARALLQSTVLGVGAYLVINGEATGGVMIASSILVSRAPIASMTMVSPSFTSASGPPTPASGET